MFNKIYLTITSLALFATVVFAIPAYSFAATISDDITAACNAADGGSVPSYCTNNTNTDNPIAGDNGIINKVANVIAFIGGIVAVIMVIYGGFRYIISNGDPGKITNARQTIVYALVGIVVLLLARTIVIYIVNKV